MKHEPGGPNGSVPRLPLLISGFMATGKSTVGRLVAKRAGVPFVDLDALIEEEAGCPISLIFSDSGEPAFRALEAEALRRQLALPGPRVIALGGGTLVDPTLRAFALAHGQVVTLTARSETIAARAGAPGRPLLDEAPDRHARIQELLAARRGAYAEAHAQVPTDEHSPESVAEIVLRAWSDPTLVVPLGQRSYAVRLTRNAPGAVAELCKSLAPSATFVVTDENVEPLAAPALRQALTAAGLAPRAEVVLEPGEAHKQLPAVEQILKTLVEAGADREAVVIALGGGVVSDIAGFAAATLLRGVRWIAIPTTLLSMVDAAVGGKTGVDLGSAKNAVGAFHQPSGVVIDPAYVLTQSRRDYVSGLAEVIKTGAIGDPELLDLLSGSHERVLGRELEVIREVVFRAVRIKTAIVTRDERESGERALLNFGHTLGHGLEAAGGFGRLTHGEAVSLGMVAILRAGVALSITPPKVAQRLEGQLAKLGLPTDLSTEPLDEALQLAALDKKRTARGLRVVLLEELGHPRIELLSLDSLRRLLF